MPAQVLATYPSNSEPGRAHEVRRAQRGDRRLYCTCKGWVFAKRDPITGERKPCRHLRQYHLEHHTDFHHEHQLELAFA